MTSSHTVQTLNKVFAGRLIPGKGASDRKEPIIRPGPRTNRMPVAVGPRIDGVQVKPGHSLGLLMLSGHSWSICPG